MIKLLCMICFMVYYFVLGNDAAVQIAMSVGGSIEGFADLMNNKAKSLQLNSTNYVTPHGLDADGHYTTAYELALLTDYALNIPKFLEIVSTKTYTITINGYPKTINNTNELLGNLKGINGVKTGFTNMAGRCLVTSCIRDDFNIICVVLGADTKNIRTTDSVKLIEYCFKNYKQIDLNKLTEEYFEQWKKINLKRISINKGDSSYCKLELEKVEIPFYPVRIDKINNINFNITTVNTLEAPVSKGSTIGNLEIKLDDKTLFNINLLTSNTVNKKGIITYLTQFIENYALYLEHI